MTLLLDSYPVGGKKEEKHLSSNLGPPSGKPKKTLSYFNFIHYKDRSHK